MQNRNDEQVMILNDGNPNHMTNNKEVTDKSESEIDNNFYCSANCFGLGECKIAPVCGCLKCKNYHRKHPTLEQYREEYGEEYPDDGAVWLWDRDFVKWDTYKLWKAKRFNRYSSYAIYLCCACTPWGKPPDNWRPR